MIPFGSFREHAASRAVALSFRIEQDRLVGVRERKVEFLLRHPDAGAKCESREELWIEADRFVQVAQRPVILPLRRISLGAGKISSRQLRIELDGLLGAV